MQSPVWAHHSTCCGPGSACRNCGEEEDVVGALTPIGSGVAQVFHDLLVELRLLLVAEVEEGEEEDRQEEGEEIKRRKSSRRDNKHMDGHDDGREWSADNART